MYEVAQKTKMEAFTDFKRKAVLLVPTHDNLRRRTSDAKRKGDNIHDVPFGDLCDMKCKWLSVRVLVTSSDLNSSFKL